MVDSNVFFKLKTSDDYRRAEDEFNLARQLQAAQIQKSLQPDITQIGQGAFLKAAQGMPLSPTENAALQYLDNKEQTLSFNPVTGNAEQKPSLLQRAGISLGGQPVAQPTGVAPSTGQPFRQALSNPQFGGNSDFLSNVDNNGNPLVGSQAPTQSGNQWDAEFQQQYNALSGNARAQQSLLEAYSKSKVSPNEGQSKDATYADRVALSIPNIEQNTSALVSPKQASLASIPLVGNFLTSKEYQSGEQAQRDIVNAILRRESGAAISPSEFDNAKKQYFPQPGDTQQTIAQKRANLEASLMGIQRSAGPSYRAPVIPKAVEPAQNTGIPKAGQEVDGYIFKGGNPADQKNWTKK